MTNTNEEASIPEGGLKARDQREPDEEQHFDYLIEAGLDKTMIWVKRALADYNAREKHPRVFLQDNRIVQLVEEEERDGTQTTSIKPVDRGGLLLILTEEKTWGKYTRKGELTQTNPPRDVLEATLSAGVGVLGDILPILDGLHTGVLLDGNYNIVCRAGYDPRTRLYLTEEYHVEAIPDTPTADDIDKVKKTLWNIFHEFRFADKSGEDSVDYQNTLAALFTAIIRPLWRGTLPIWAVSKSSAGTGGTLLQQVVCTLASGQLPTPYTYPDNAAEMEKQYKTIIKNRERFAIIDNIPPARDWVTATLLTATGGGGDKISFRDFGRLGSVERPIETFFAVNGINLDIRADVCRRVIPVRIVSEKTWQDERWSRTKEELCDLAIRSHPEIIRSAAVLHRYWELKGKPKPTSCTGNISEYATWYNEICGMLFCAGYTNLLSNLEEVQTVDNSADTDAADFITALYDRFGSAAFTPSQLVEAINTEVYNAQQGGGEGVFFGLLDEERAGKARRRELNSKSIGRMLTTEYLDRVFPDCQYRLRKVRKTKGYVYVLEPLENQTQIGM